MSTMAVPDIAGRRRRGLLDPAAQGRPHAAGARPAGRGALRRARHATSRPGSRSATTPPAPRWRSTARSGRSCSGSSRSPAARRCSPACRSAGSSRVLGVGLVGFVLSFLCWQVSAAPAGQNFMPLVNIIRGTFVLALPLIFGALGRGALRAVRVVNVAIEGQLLMGAFSGALFGSISGSVWVGLVAAAIGGALISLLLAVFAIRYLVDQVVIGIVLNLLARRRHRLPLRAADADRRGEIQQRAPLQQLGDPAAEGHPAARAGAVPRQHLPLPRAAAGAGDPHRAVPHPVGPADPLGRRAPDRRRHARRQGAAACATATCCWPAWSPASAARPTRWRSTRSPRT